MTTTEELTCNVKENDDGRAERFFTVKELETYIARIRRAGGSPGTKVRAMRVGVSGDIRLVANIDR